MKIKTKVQLYYTGENEANTVTPKEGVIIEAPVDSVKSYLINHYGVATETSHIPYQDYITITENDDDTAELIWHHRVPNRKPGTEPSEHEKNLADYILNDIAKFNDNIIKKQYELAIARLMRAIDG